MLEIKRNGLIITPKSSLDASEGSYDVPVTLINDDTYTDYTINMYFGWYAGGVLKKRKAEIDASGKYLISREAFQQKGMIHISFLLEKIDKSQGLMTNALSYQVKNAPNVIIEVPADPSWEELVKEWIEELAGAVDVDPSLRKSGYAADAKATGDAIDKLSDEIVDLKNQVNGVNYTNVLSSAIDVDGSPYNGGKGYKEGYRFSTSSGTETAQSGYCCTGFIAVNGGDTIRIKNITKGKAGSGSIMFFQSDRLASNRLGSPIYEQYFDDYLVDGIYTITPDNCNSLGSNTIASYFVLSTGVIDENTIITINEEIVGKENSDDEEETTSEDVVEILMPSYAVTTVGVEFNIYHKNIVWANKPLDCYGLKWTISDTSVPLQRLEECLRIMPTSENVGSHTLKLQVKNPIDNIVIVEKQMTLHIIERTTVIDKNVVYMGDSLTYSRDGLYASEIQYNLSDGGIISAGTQTGTQAINQVGEVKHEGYNGATCGGFLNANVTSGFTNPFYNTSTKQFDFSYFVNKIGKSVHAVCLNLGANNLGNQVQGVADLTTIINKIKAYDSNIPIIVSLPVGCAGQDSWRNGTYTATEMRWHWRNLIKAYIEAFDNKISNVFISTPYFNVDVDNDFPTETVARCSRDTTTIVRQNDQLHPTRIGTLKMADSYYPYVLKALVDTYGEDTPTSGYTNLNSGEAGTVLHAGVASLDKVVYQVGGYISTSSGSALNTDASTTTFGMIEAQDGDTIYVKGVKIDVVSQATTSQTHARFGFAKYDSSATSFQTNVIAEHKFYNNSTNYVTLTCLDSATNYYSIKINNTGLDYNYVLFSLVTDSNGAKALIITKNQEITD